MALVDLATEGTAEGWTVTRCVGAGGFGEVYRVERSGPGGAVMRSALKILHLHLVHHADGHARLLREASALAMLRHPNVVALQNLVSVDEGNAQPAEVGLLCELVEGDDLDGCMTAGLPPRPLLEVVARVADALHAAWTSRHPRTGQAMQLVHRDVKPSNVRVGPNGEVKLLDFGIVYTQQETRLTGTGAAIGTVQYMPPEAFLDVEPRPAGDVYALGVILLLGLGGAPWLRDLSLGGAAAMAADARRFEVEAERRLGSLGAGVPEPLKEMIRAMLAFAPEDRPDALGVAERIEASLPDTSGPTLRAWCRSHRWPAPRRLRGRLVEGSRLTLRPLISDLPPPPMGMDPAPGPSARSAEPTVPPTRVPEPTSVPQPVMPPPAAPAPAVRRIGLWAGLAGLAGLFAVLGDRAALNEPPEAPSGAPAAPLTEPSPAAVDPGAPPPVITPPVSAPSVSAPPVSAPPAPTEKPAPPTRRAPAERADPGTPAPIPATPAATPLPVAPAPAPLPTTIVHVRESVGRPLGAVRLRGPDGVTRPPGEVPAGRSVLTVEVPGDAPITTTLDLPATGPLSVTCMISLRRCTVDRR